MDNSPKTRQDVVNEIDRYIGTPGQALAYKIGQLKISGLREKAARELGPKFDLRAFNDAVLETGSVPLDVLEKHIDAWIAAQNSAGYSGRRLGWLPQPSALVSVRPSQHVLVQSTKPTAVLC